MSRIVLYGPRVPYTEKVVRALGYKKRPYAWLEPRGPEDYQRWSPETGLLPVIEIDGQRTADSTQILLELDRRFPDPPLVGDDPKVAVMQRRLEDWADESFFWYWSQWRHTVAPDGDPASARAGPPSFSWWRPWTWFPAFRMQPGEPADARLRRRQRFLLEELGNRLDDLLGMLGDRPFFYAETPSMGDFAVYAMLVTVRDGAFWAAHGLLEARPALVPYMQRVEDATGGPTSAPPS